MSTLAETIREITRKHIVENKGLIIGQNLSGVGLVQNTLPEMLCTDPANEGGLLDLPTCDTAGPYFCVGAALAGRRPIFICRFQGFMVFNAAAFLYASISKAMWNQACPVFIRSQSVETLIGPVASGSRHSLVLGYPGMKIAAPITPNEYQQVWSWFMENDDPVYCSEHRFSYSNSDELPDIIVPHALFRNSVSMFGISACRLWLSDARKELEKVNISCNIYGIVWLKPFNIIQEYIDSLNMSEFGVVIDSDYTCGMAEHIAYQLMIATGKPIYALGLKDQVCGFSKDSDNLTPSVEEIVEFVRSKL